MKKSQEQVKILQEIVLEIIKTEKEISPNLIFSNKKWKWGKKINLSELLIKSEINPDCVLQTQKGKYYKDLGFLKKIMGELKTKVGRNNLNDNSLRNFGMIELPKSLETKGKFSFSNKLKIPKKKVNPNSIMTSLCRTFEMKWGEVLELSGYKNIERRKHLFSHNEIIDSLKIFVETEYKIKWNSYKHDFHNCIKPHEFKTKNNKLFKLIHRIPEKLDININNKHISQFSLGLFTLMFIDSKGEISQIHEYINSIVKKIEIYSLEGRLIKKRKGNETDIQKSILQGYVNGYFGYGDYFGEPTLYRYINHNVKENSKLYIKKLGLETDSLRYLKSVIESKYNSKEKIWIKFRELVSTSIQTNTNCLTREYLETSDPDFIKDCFRVEKIKTNSWEKILKEYGLSSDIWSNSYSIISHKGNVFQRSVFELIGKYLKEVEQIPQLNKNSFIHNKLISKGIKPDFVFKDFIVDTKLSVSLDKDKRIGETEREQIEKYQSYFKKPVIIITLNQNEQYFRLNNLKIKNVNFKNGFKNWFESRFSVNINDTEISEVFSRVNNIPFWKI